MVFMMKHFLFILFNFMVDTDLIKNVEIVISEWIETAKENGFEIPKAKGKLIFT
ncbi:MAG: hypothetical protein HFI05_07605 [Lachnospiraceae bacterium]|jgi:hypothetical protein|nr:hypothetical protein [Lachnospiraceae bacterium]